MPTIYINGDSQTCGTTDVIDPENLEHSYATYLASKIGYQIVDNQALGGASNDRIFRLTENYLYDCERGDKEFPDFILIGWSECTRFDWFRKGSYVSLGQVGQSSSITNDDMALSFHYQEGKREYPERYRWQKEELTNDDAITGILYYNYQRMMNLHDRLAHLKIPHLFLNAHLGFTDVHPKTGKNRGYHKVLNYLNFDWDNCFWNMLDPDNSSFVTWGLNKGYSYVEGWHLHHEAHIEFSQVLYDYINQYDLLNKYR